MGNKAGFCRRGVSPRPSNTGVQTTQEAILLDWLSWTLPYDKGLDFVGACGWELLSLERGWLGYSDAYAIASLGAGALCAHSPGRPDMGWHFSLSGQALGQVGDVLGLMRLVRSLGGKFSRLDVALDDKAGLLSWERIDRAMLQGAFTSRWKHFEPKQFYRKGRGGMKLSGRGWAFGTRASDVYARCYDKKLEQEVKGVDLPPDCKHWVRFELETKSDKADRLADLVLSGDWNGVLGVLRGYLEFKELVQVDTNKTRWIVASWWAAFLRNVAKVTGFFATHARRTLGDILNWLERQVAPSLALVLAVAGGDLGGLLGMADRGKARWKPRHLALLGVSRFGVAES